MKREELIDYIRETYGAEPEYPWSDLPNYAVFRHANNRKWFAVIMDVPSDKLGLKGKAVKDIVNLKCDPLMAGSLTAEKGIIPAYHMSKSRWISVLLEDLEDEEKLKVLLDISFDLTAVKRKDNKNG